MCNGFGGIIGKDGSLHFCEPDLDGDCSHSLILKRLGWKENESPFLRSFVRFQFPDWTAESFEWDEDCTLPGWVGDEHREMAVKTLLRVAAAWAEYEKVRDAAWAEYEKVRDAAWDELIHAFSSIPGYVPEVR